MVLFDEMQGFSDIVAVQTGPTYTVVRANDDKGRAVLVKTSSADFAAAEAWSTLRAEYDVGKDLHHDHIVETLDFVESGSRPMLVLADPGGEPLRAAMDRKPLTVRMVLRVALHVATGLAELHERDIVHRDIKPDNIILSADGQHATIIDLGIATNVPRQQTTLASPDRLIGTLAYISPEQTGRTSRVVDLRSDLYSVGIVLYEMLAGVLPFTEPEPLELVHQHLAVAPTPLLAKAPDLPLILCQLVEQLIAKDPDDRYRSAVGLIHDLRQIEDHLRRGQSTDELTLSGVDISTRFHLPDRLFGRESELAELERSLGVAADGVTSVLLVGGFSGIGKSRLIEELRPSVNHLRGYQAVGKIDQMNRGSASHAVIAALRDLVRQLLAENNQRVAQLKGELIASLGAGAAMLVESVPELGAILGPLDPAPKLDSLNERNVFNQLISSFLTTVATVEHPLVLVLDDLQWADATTIDFIERTCRWLDGAALLVVGIYRDNEVDESHPLSLLRRRLKESNNSLPEIQLEPLADAAMAQLVSTALSRTIEDASPLTNLCISHTGSNPFFVRFFLQALFEDRLLQLDHWTGAWSWDFEQVNSRGITANVAELAMRNIDRVSTEAQTALAVMAIIGVHGDSEFLTDIGLVESDRALTELATHGLVNLTSDRASTQWAIAHDRIQESASQLFSAEETVAWHRLIGAGLQRQVDSGRDTSIFAVLRHRNAASVGPDHDLARANLAGGQAAMRATSFATAQGYFATGISLLGEDQWLREPDTAFALHLGGADAARLSTNFDEMARLLAIIAAEETDPLRRVEASQLEILHLSHEGKNFEAVDVARQQLSELGWRLPTSPGLPAVIAGLVRTRMKLRPFSIEQLEQFDEMEDETARAMISVMNETLSSAYFADPNILALLIQKGLRLTVKYGNAPESAFCYASHGMIMSGIAKKPEAGVAFGDLGVRLADRYGPSAMPCRVRYARDALVAPVRVPLREIGPSLDVAYQVGNDTGDVGYATAALLWIGLHRLLSGVGLDRLTVELDATCSRLSSDAQDRNLVLAVIVTQFVADLREGPGPGGPFTGPHADGDTMIEKALESGDQLHVAWALNFRAMSRWHHGDVVGARADIHAAASYVDALLGQAMLPVHHLYGVLVETGSADGKRGSLAKAKRHRKRLAWFAKQNPTTHEAALLIADGAIAARRKKRAKATQRLQVAIEVATKHRLPHEVAIAGRLLAELHERTGDEAEAAACRDTAAEAYRAWGSKYFGDRSLATTPAGSTSITTTVSGSDAYEGLDLATVVQTSEAIGEEIELDRLVARLLDVTLRNAGAELGVLYRVDGDSITVESAGTMVAGSDGVVLTVGEAAENIPVAESVVRLVARTAEPVIADCAVNDPHIGTDPVVKARSIRSLLCLPLITQGRLQGILYLENNQVDGAFTAERFRLLRIISSQAAGALEKARLLDAQTRLIEAQGRFVPEQFLQSLGHSNLLAVELAQGTIKEMDMLFTDIRGFTTIIENMTPDMAMEFINNYLAHMEPVISEHGGFIDNYEGDAILALFDAGSDAGIKAAVAMAKAEHKDNHARQAAGQAPVHTGIGVNTDAIMMGVIGGQTRMQATIIGDGVNLASRIESLTKRYKARLLVSEYTVDRLLPETNLTLRPLERVLVVGRVTPVRIFEVLDALDDNQIEKRLTNLPLYMEAVDAYENHRFDDAASMFSEVLAADPDDGGARVLAARAYELLEADLPTGHPPITQLDKK